MLAAFFALFVLFLYGPIITIGILSFQGPQGGLTFPDERRFAALVRATSSSSRRSATFGGAFRRSLALGLSS